MSATFAQVEREALTLPAEERARLADKLWESLAGRDGLQVVMTPALEGLLDEGLEHLNRAKSTEEVRRQK
jgi:Putative addiction module component